MLAGLYAVLRCAVLWYVTVDNATVWTMTVCWVC